MSIRIFIFKRIIIPFLIGSIIFSVVPYRFSPSVQAADNKSSAEVQLASLTPEEKVGQLFLITFSGVDTSEISPIFDLIGKYHIGGVILERINNNFLDPDNMPEDCWSLINNLQVVEYNTSSLSPEAADLPENRNSEYIPLLIGLSQEGDQSKYTELINGLSPIPSQMSLGATWDPNLAEEIGEQVGRELSSLGINLLLGPSLDVISNPTTSQSDLGVRSFGGDPYWVGKFGQAYVKGIHQGSLNNIAVIGKYFPGLGSSDRLPEEEVATVRKSLEQLTQIDLAPFFAVTGNAPSPDSAVDGLLNSHIRYQGLQGNIRSTTRPISLDPQAFDLLMSLEPLRNWRDSGGLIISDNLGSQALQQLYDPSGASFKISRVAVDAFIAGNDILFFGNYGIENKPIPSSEIISTIKFFAQKYVEDQDFADRVDSSVLRILELKNSLYSTFNISTVLTSDNNLAALGKSTSAETVARQSATLINPDITELDSVLQSPPTSAERLVILSDSEYTTVCSDCLERPTLSTTSLENAIIRLYGPMSGRQLVRANITSYSFKELTTLLDFPSEVEQMVTDLYNANWIIIAALDVNQERAYSQALPRLLSERQDLLRDKKIIVFALGAPYYLDATNISKITAFFALYNKLPASLDVAARILFKEFPSFPGRLPVSLPGINYDLISATSPDPNKIFTISIREKIAGETSPEATPNTPAAPVFRVEDLIELFTDTIVDHNGNPVPDGTPVTFYVTSQGLTNALPQVTTIDGSASARYLIENNNKISIHAESSFAHSNFIEINILGSNTENGSENNQSTPIFSTEQPAVNPQSPIGTEQPQPDLPVKQGSPWSRWLLALVLNILISLMAYQAGAKSGLVLWGIRWGLASFISGLIVYNYLQLKLPGVSLLFPGEISALSFGFAVLFGSLIGWLVAYIIQRIFNP